MKFYEMELSKAAKVLIEDVFQLKDGETFIITADTESDERVVKAVSAAAFAVEAKPMAIWLASPLGVGKAADPMLPINALTEVLKQADAWVEFNNKWLLYSTPFINATQNNEKLRYLCLVGMDVDMLVRLIGRVDTELLEKFMVKVENLTKNAKRMKIKTPAGTDVEFENYRDMLIGCNIGKANVPGIHFLSGQIGWAPIWETINGKIVFDGSIDPPCRLLTENVTLTVEKGVVKDIKGGRQAGEFKKWLESFNDPNMFRLAHVCYGFNPKAKLTGNIVEDERIWGCTEWGLGYFSPTKTRSGIPAPSHTDGICLNSSVWLDDVQLLDNGRIVYDEELKDLEAKLL